MYKIGLKQGIEEKGRDCSNVSKIIVKQGIGGGLGYCANGPITIGKLDFEGGIDTCAHTWKTFEICKCISAGRLHAENKQQDCGAAPPPG